MNAVEIEQAIFLLAKQPFSLGSTSVGDHDISKRALEAQGVTNGF